MPVSFRNIIPSVVVVVILLFTGFNLRLYYRTTALKVHNRALILQQDSIRSVHMNLTREMLNYPQQTIQFANDRNEANVTPRSEPAVLGN